MEFKYCKGKKDCRCSRREQVILLQSLNDFPNPQAGTSTNNQPGTSRPLCQCKKAKGVGTHTSKETSPGHRHTPCSCVCNAGPSGLNIIKKPSPTDGVRPIKCPPTCKGGPVSSRPSQDDPETTCQCRKIKRTNSKSADRTSKDRVDVPPRSSSTNRDRPPKCKPSKRGSVCSNFGRGSSTDCGDCCKNYKTPCTCRRNQSTDESFKSVPSKSGESFDTMPSSKKRSPRNSDKPKDKPSKGQNGSRDKFDKSPDRSRDKFDKGRDGSRDKFDKGPDRSRDKFDKGPDRSKEKFDKGPDRSKDKFDKGRNGSRDKPSRGQNGSRDKLGRDSRDKQYKGDDESRDKFDRGRDGGRDKPYKGGHDGSRDKFDKGRDGGRDKPYKAEHNGSRDKFDTGRDGSRDKPYRGRDGSRDKPNKGSIKSSSRGSSCVEIGMTSIRSRSRGSSCVEIPISQKRRSKECVGVSPKDICDDQKKVKSKASGKRHAAIKGVSKAVDSGRPFWNSLMDLFGSPYGRKLLKALLLFLLGLKICSEAWYMLIPIRGLNLVSKCPCCL